MKPYWIFLQRNGTYCLNKPRSLQICRPCHDSGLVRRPFNTKARIRSEACLCEICGRQSGTGTGLHLSTSAVFFQNRSNKAAYSIFRVTPSLCDVAIVSVVK